MKEVYKWAKSHTYWLVLNLTTEHDGKTKSYPIKLGFKIKAQPSSKIFAHVDYHFVDTPTGRYLTLHLTEDQYQYVRTSLYEDIKRVAIFDLQELTQLPLHKLNRNLHLSYVREYIRAPDIHLLDEGLRKHLNTNDTDVSSTAS